MIKELIILAAFAWAMLAAKLYRDRRRRAIREFDKSCRELLWTNCKLRFNKWHEWLGMDLQELYRYDLEVYEAVFPKESKMLNSFKELTIDNWFSPQMKSAIFGIGSKPIADREKMEAELTIALKERKP